MPRYTKLLNLHTTTRPMVGIEQNAKHNLDPHLRAF